MRRSAPLIFVTVGNPTQGFARLLEAVDQLVGARVIADDVLMQTGNSNVTLTHARAKDFISPEEFDRLIRTADVLICHAGAGTIIHALSAGHIPVVMPRLKRYAEHVNDHQTELAEALAREQRVILAREPGDLPGAIEAARSRKGEVSGKNTPPMIELLRRAVEELAARPRGCP